MLHLNICDVRPVVKGKGAGGIPARKIFVPKKFLRATHTVVYTCFNISSPSPTYLSPFPLKHLVCLSVSLHDVKHCKVLVSVVIGDLIVQLLSQLLPWTAYAFNYIRPLQLLAREHYNSLTTYRMPF